MRLLFILTVHFAFCSGLFGQESSLLNEGFESWPPNGWTSYTLGAGTGWIQSWQNPSEAAYHGNHSAYPNINNDNCNNWLVSPPLVISDADYELLFWERFNSIEFYDNSVVNISTGSPDPLDGDYNLLFSNNDTSTVWVQRQIDLSAYAGDTVFIAFQYTGTWHIWFVDDVIVGPSNFTDGALKEIINPVGASMNPGIEPINVNMVNLGVAQLDTMTIHWSVNGIQQTPYQNNQLGLESNEEMIAELGSFSFDSAGAYIISLVAESPNDINPLNDTLRSTYAISDLLDGRLTSIRPEAYSPNTGVQDVRILLENRGGNLIDSAQVDWTVNGAPQTPFSARDLRLEPGQTAEIKIGQFDFPKGVHIINASAEITGDTSTFDNHNRSYAAIDTFWESFEGRIFPPENWSFNFGVKDNINFDTPPHGIYYYSAFSDDNFFGVVSDTLFTPLLDIKNGDFISFRLKTNPFLATTNKAVAKNWLTGEIIMLETLNTIPNEWDPVNIDLSSVNGVHSIGIITTSESSGQTKLDLITSNATVYIPEYDLAIAEPEVYFLASKDVTENYPCTIKNYGSSDISGADFTIRLMDETLGELGSVPGMDIGQWGEVNVSIPYVFEELARFSVYFEIAYALDERLSNNRSRSSDIQVVPASTILKPIGSADYINLNFPFSSNGSTQSLGEDDISQTIYYAEEINGQGNLYGMVYKYDNLLSADYVQSIPFRVWMAQTDRSDLEEGWYPSQEMTLIFDDTLQILPGDNHDLYIPFDNPIPYSGLNNLIIQDYAYDPEWPPSIMRIYATSMPFPGPVRTISQLDVFGLDPLAPESWFSSSHDLAFTTFVIEPILDTGLIAGQVFGFDSLPIAGAVLEVKDIGISTVTEMDGAYTFPYLPFNEYSITASADSFNQLSQVILLDTSNYQLDFYLEPRPQVSINGVVEAEHAPGLTIENVSVYAKGYSNDTTITNTSGAFILSNIFGTSHYDITFSVYGYYDTTITVSVVAENIDVGVIKMKQRFLSPFDVHAFVEDGQTQISWKDPLKSKMELIQNDLDVCSFSYTNEPNEVVWLGNLFGISDTTTLTAVEIRSDIYDLSDGIVRIDVFNKKQDLIASSEPFIIEDDTTMIVDIPNIVVYSDVYAMLHWENNPESTHALCIDYSHSSIPNTAAIKYPDQPIQLFSEFLGGGTPPISFLVRLHTLDAGNPVIFQESKAYNIYKGDALDFPDSENWQLINTEPTSNLWFVDDTWTNSDESGLYRYSVETIYTSGSSEETFSNIIQWDQTTDVIELAELKGRFNLFPNPARNHFTIDLELETQASLDIAIYHSSGQLIEHKSFGQHKQFNQSRMVSDLTDGSYLLHLKIDDQLLIRRFVVIKE